MNLTTTTQFHALKGILSQLVGIALISLSPSAFAQNYAPNMGINLGSPIHGLTFVNAITDTRKGFQVEGDNGVNATVDANGWPTQDFFITIADLRNARGQQVDPDPHVVDITGTYAISFNGVADVSNCCVTNSEFRNISYDNATNTTTLDFFLGEGEKQAFLQLRFRNTQRNPDAALNTGITNLRVNRPGYDLSTTQPYTDVWLNAIAPFSTLRYMDWLHTNNNAEFLNGDKTKPIEVDWADRKVTLPEEQTTGTIEGLRGLAWETIIEHINYTGKDAWLNIPVHASDDYVRQLARLIRDNVNPSVKLYLEYSNELWNYGFDQFDWNFNKAQQEVADGSNLDYDGSNNANLWAARRTARRIVEIGQIFRDQGVGTIGDRIRPVLTQFSSRAGNLAAGGRYESMVAMLKYIEDNYGDPDQYVYSISRTGYFGAREIEALPEGATVEEILDAAERGIPTDFDEFSELADQYNLNFDAYEGSPGHKVNSAKNIANRIRAERSPRMGELIKRTLVDAWFANGGDLFMYFATSKYYTKSGFWGMSDDITRLDRGFKHQALLDVINGVDINPRPLIATEDLAIGTAGVAYELTLDVYSGNAPLSWSIIRGSLPDGLSFSSDGVISGTPTAAGVTEIEVRVADADGDQASRSFELQIKGSIDIPRVSRAPTIDGAAESLWGDVPAYRLDNTIRGSAVSNRDLSARFRPAWDASNLYLLVEVTDERLVNDSDDTFDDDGIEVYLDINNDKRTSYGLDDYQVIFRYGDSDIIINPSGRSVAGIARAESATSDGYLMELAFPWEALGEANPQAGAQVGLDIHAADDDDGGNRDTKISWSALEDRSFTDPTTFGIGVLTGGGSPPPSDEQTTVVIYAAGRANTETMELRIDGQAVKTWTNVGGKASARSFVAYAFDVDGTVNASQVQVAFTNDDEGRDLRVNRIMVGGTSYQTEAPTTFSTGTWTSGDGCGDGYKQSEWLHCNGYFAYEQTNARTAGVIREKAVALPADAEVHLFPNPAKDILHVQLPSHEGEVVITLTDLVGREVLRYRQPNADELSLPVHTLPQGLYQISLQQAGQRTTRKLLIE